jgi:aminoglycoside phosphotransferase (APT) family kinase protein
MGAPGGNAKLDDFGGLLDWDNLLDWLAAQDLPGRGPVLDAELLLGGSQNTIVRIRRADGAFVLRRPPRHPRPASDTTMLREARVLGALA